MITLVTGASGMLGANLIRQLSKNDHQVRAFTRQPITHPLLEGVPFEHVFGDLSDLAKLAGAMRGCDRVYHTAGFISYHRRHWNELFRSNVEGTVNVLRAARESGVGRVVVTSSTAAVGIPARNGPPLSEAAAFHERHRHVPYMYSKWLAERAALSFAGLEVVVVNPATIYGAGDVKMNTGILFRQIKNGRVLFCPPGGTSVVSVRDCVAGHLLAMERGLAGRRYILCSSDHSYRDLFARIAYAVGGRAPRLVIPWTAAPLAYTAAITAEMAMGVFGMRPITRHVVTLGFSNRYFCSNRARTELGWAPAQSTDEMLAEAATFYREHGLI